MSQPKRQRRLFRQPIRSVALALVLLGLVCPLRAQVLTFEPQPQVARIINPQIANPNPIIHAGGPESAALGSQGGIVFAVPTSSYALSSPIQQVEVVEPYPTPATTATPATGGSQAVPPFGSGATPAGTPGNWDPYAAKGGQSSSFFGSGSQEFFEKIPDESKKIARRFVEKVSLDYTYIPRGSDQDGFGINEIAYQTEFTFPCRLLHETEPIYVVPGFDLLFWDGPTGPPVNSHHMSPNGYSAYLEIGAAPRYTKDFAFELWVRAGLYSDFNKLTSDSARLSGRGAVLIGLTNEMEGVLGVEYINRNRIKILPRIGVIWKPNEKVTWRLVFPDPKLSRFLAKVNNVDWTFYLQGNYGGGCWTIADPEDDGTYLTDYNDIRVGVGLEFTNHAWVNGFFELGGAFNRELYSQGEAWCKPPSMVYLKAGFHF